MPRFGMLPEIRAAYKQALAELRAAGQEAKTYYKYVTDPKVAQTIATQGPRMGQHEPWKPEGSYFTPNLYDIPPLTVGLNSSLADMKTLLREGSIIRMVPKPGTTARAETDNKLAGQFDAWMKNVAKPKKNQAEAYSNGIGYQEPNYYDLPNKDQVKLNTQWSKDLPPSDLFHVQEADGAPDLLESIVRNPKAVRIFSKDKAWLPALMASVLGVGASAEDSDAVMLPEVRRLMLEAQRLGGKKLFHSTINPKNLMTEGIGDPLRSSSVKELHKPMGFYAADRVEKIPGHLSGMYDGTQTTQALREKLNRHMTSVEEMFNPEVVGDTPIVRMILKPDAKVREIPETFMHDYNRELKNIRRDLRKIDGEPAPMLPLSETELTQHWQDLADVLKIDNVDGQPRLAEWLTLNPDKVQGMYWENMSWTPEGGTVVHGPYKKRRFGWPSERGASRSDLGLSPSSGKKWESSSVGGFEPPGPGPKPEAMNGFTDPNVAAKYYKEMYDQHISEGNEMMAEYALENAKQVKQYMKQQAGQSKLGIGQLNPYQPGEIKVKNYMDTDWSGKPVAGAIATALGVGGLVGGASDADAFPLGKLKAINKPIANATRSTEEFYHLLGHKIQGKEVVDVLRNPKNDWRYVIVKDEKGKRYQLPMTKDYLNVYAGAKGTQDYLERFRLEGYQGKKLQALKSLNIRENKRFATEDVKTAEFKEWNKSQMLKAKEIDPELVNDYAYVKVLNDEGGGTQGQSLYMPREYADFLAAKGYVKILKH